MIASGPKISFTLTAANGNFEPSSTKAGGDIHDSSGDAYLVQKIFYPKSNGLHQLGRGDFTI